MSAQGKEDALYGAVFAGGHADRFHARVIAREFGMADAKASALVEQLARHEGNARCGITARALPGQYGYKRVRRMVGDAAERHSFEMAGLEGGSNGGDDGRVRPPKLNPSIAGVLHPKSAPQPKLTQCAAGTRCAHPGEPIENGRRRDARYHHGCKQRVKRERKRAAAA